MGRSPKRVAMGGVFDQNVGADGWARIDRPDPRRYFRNLDPAYTQAMVWEKIADLILPSLSTLS